MVVVVRENGSGLRMTEKEQFFDLSANNYVLCNTFEMQILAYKNVYERVLYWVDQGIVLYFL